MTISILNKILYLSLFIFLILLVIFIIFNYFKPSPINGLKINLIGPNEVNSLENYSYNLYIENNSNQNLSDVNLKILLSNGSFFNEKPNSKEISFYLGNLAAKKTYNQQLNLFFLNEGGLRENIKIALMYKIENKPHVFEKEENFLIFVKNPPLKVQFFLPSKIYINQEFQSSFRIINLTKQKLDNLKIIIEPPLYFKLISIFPSSENYYFQFPSINSLETKDITLIGQIQDIKSNGLFSVKMEFDFLNQTYSLSKEIVKIDLLENPISFNIKTIPSNESIPIGSRIFYEITLENKSQTTLENNEVKIIFSGPFDILSLNSDGYLSELDQTLIWNSRNKPELLIFKPKDKIVLNFSINVFQSYPILGNNNKNFSTKIRVEFRTPTIPSEIETTKKEYIVWYEDEKKIIGNISFDSELIYNDEYFVNSGPFPLVPNQPTTLSWHIKIKTIGEDFNNLILSTKLPIGVEFTGKTGGDAIINNVRFDPKSGNFIYYLNNIPANLGYLNKELDLIFQIVVTLPANINLYNFVIIPTVNYSLTGDFSKVQLSGNIRELSLSNITK